MPETRRAFCVCMSLSETPASIFRDMHEKRRPAFATKPCCRCYSSLNKGVAGRFPDRGCAPCINRDVHSLAAPARALLESLFHSAVAAARPETCLPPNLPEPPARGRLVILAAGKAAGSMTQVAERHYAGLPPTRLA